MFDFLSSCSLLSSLPQPGQYAFEAFKKVPVVGGLVANLSNLSNIANNFGNLTGIGNIASLSNFGTVGNMIGGFGPNNGAKRPNTGGSGGLDLSQFLNNTPLDSVKSNDSNFSDLIDKNQDAVIKKVLKSNYNDLIRKHQESG